MGRPQTAIAVTTGQCAEIDDGRICGRSGTTDADGRTCCPRHRALLRRGQQARREVLARIEQAGAGDPLDVIATLRGMQVAADAVPARMPIELEEALLEEGASLAEVMRAEVGWAKSRVELGRTLADSQSAAIKALRVKRALEEQLGPVVDTIEREMEGELYRQLSAEQARRIAAAIKERIRQKIRAFEAENETG